MTVRRVTAAEARAWFEHPSQLRGAMLDSPDDLPVCGVEYLACGPICGAFHRAPWEGVWFGHYGVQPEGWGRLIEPARAVLAAFLARPDAETIIGWTDSGNRAAISFARRLGFVETGRMHAGRVICTEYRG